MSEDEWKKASDETLWDAWDEWRWGYDDPPAAGLFDELERRYRDSEQENR